MATKTKLSKNVMLMKFMQRSVMRIEQEQNEEERQRDIDDEHWVLDVPELKEKESRYQMESSYAVCEDLVFGRQSYKGCNPEIEKLMKSKSTEKELQSAEIREKDIGVGDEEMAERYESLIGTIGKKFTKKRRRPSNQEDLPRSDIKKRVKKFLRPKDDSDS